MAKAFKAFAVPGDPENDFWMLQFFAVTTFWFVETQQLSEYTLHLFGIPESPHKTESVHFFGGLMNSATKEMMHLWDNLQEHTRYVYVAAQ